MGGGEPSHHAIPAGTFELRVPIPPAAHDKARLIVELAVDQIAVSPGDGRELGLAFVSAEVVP
jgi:hypothetical protein